MKDKIIMVTGSSDGIGLQTAADLAAMGARVIVHGRNPSRAEQASEEVRKMTGSSSISTVSGDLSSLQEIRAMAATLKDSFHRIDVLVNNAGVYMNNRQISADGYELTFAVNHLSYFLLTGLLLDLLNNSGYARIVNVASQAHGSRLDFDNLQGERYYEGYDAYSRSKLCNILFTFRLAERLKNTHITANVLHPGVIATKLLHAGWSSGGSRLSEGSRTSVYLASSPEVEGISGQYFAHGKMTRPASVAHNHEVQDRLWEISEQFTGFPFDQVIHDL